MRKTIRFIGPISWKKNKSWKLFSLNSSFNHLHSLFSHCSASLSQHWSTRASICSSPSEVWCSSSAFLAIAVQSENHNVFCHWWVFDGNFFLLFSMWIWPCQKRAFAVERIFCYSKHPYKMTQLDDGIFDNIQRRSLFVCQFQVQSLDNSGNRGKISVKSHFGTHNNCAWLWSSHARFAHASFWLPNWWTLTNSIFPPQYGVCIIILLVLEIVVFCFAFIYKDVVSLLFVSHNWEFVIINSN